MSQFNHLPKKINKKDKSMAYAYITKAFQWNFTWFILLFKLAKTSVTYKNRKTYIKKKASLGFHFLNFNCFLWK